MRRATAKRIEALAKKVPGHIEGALAVGRAALAAQEFAKARTALASYLAAPTKRVALLMAELERAEHNDEGRAREWIARALNAAPDPAWTADGHVSDRWLPVSPVSGRLDAFTWRVPLTAIPAPVIEPASTPLAAPVVAASERKADNAPAVQQKTETPPAAAEPVDATPAVRRSRPVQAMKPEPVIPLVHAPDDPGPDAAEGSEPRAEPQNGGWRKIFE